MFSRLIRVILTADIDRFASGMGRATRLLGSFLGAARGSFSGAVGFANNLINALAHLPQAIQTVTTAIEGMFAPAILAENYKATMGAIVGDTEQAAEMFQHLEKRSIATGAAMTDLTQAGHQMAVMLKSTQGEVDMDEWTRWTSVLERLSALRPDVPLQFLGRALSALVAGNTAQLTTVLDVNIRQLIETLGPEFQGFIEDVEGATEAQLGQVTRLGEGAERQLGNALELAEAIANAVGATDELITAQANTFEGQVNRIKAIWDRFKRVVGEPILDELSDGLERLMDTLEENQPAIDAFAESLGEWAAVNLERLIDWLFNQDWAAVAEDIGEVAQEIKDFLNDPKTAESAEALRDALLDLAGGGYEGVKEFLQNTDWMAIGEAASSIAHMINIATGNEMMNQEPGARNGRGAQGFRVPDRDAPQATGNGIQITRGGPGEFWEELANGIHLLFSGQYPGLQINRTAPAPGGVDWREAGGVGTWGQQQEVIVRIESNDDRFNYYVDQRSREQAIQVQEDFVEAKRRAGGARRGSSRQ